MATSVLIALAALTGLVAGCASTPPPDAAPVPPSAVGLTPAPAAPTPTALRPSSAPGPPTLSDDGGSYPAEVVVAQAVTSQVVAYTAASTGSSVQGRFASPTANGGPLVFQAVELAGDWLKVLLPVRPNGTTGWIRYADVTLSRNPYRVEIDKSDHRLRVLELGRTTRETVVGIGTGATPTPVGSFYLTELLAPPDPGGVYGPFAFGLSGYSETLTSFNGGEAIIGIHGTDDPSSLGQDVSHGCVRVDNEVIADLARLLPLGTPVIITA